MRKVGVLALAQKVADLVSERRVHRIQLVRCSPSKGGWPSTLINGEYWIRGTCFECNKQEAIKRAIRKCRHTETARYAGSNAARRAFGFATPEAGQR